MQEVADTYKQRYNFNKNTSTPFICNKKFSIYAYLIGKVMGDGHLSYSYSLQFVSADVNDLEDLMELIFQHFNIPLNKMFITKRIHKGISYSLRVNHPLLARILYCLGAPKGNKTKQGFLIPDWILVDKNYKKMFLMALLEDELCTIKIERKNYSIKPKFKMSKQEHLIEDLRLFLQQVRGCIESFGVKCSKVSKEPKGKLGQITKDLYFDVLRNKKNIIKFEEEIGFFLNKHKKEKLSECSKILRSTLKPDVDKNKIISLRKQGLSIRQIAKMIPHKKTTVHRVIKEQKI